MTASSRGGQGEQRQGKMKHSSFVKMKADVSSCCLAVYKAVSLVHVGVDLVVGIAGYVQQGAPSSRRK